MDRWHRDFIADEVRRNRTVAEWWVKADEADNRIREMEKENERKQILLTEMTSLYDDVKAENERLKEENDELDASATERQLEIYKLKKMLKGRVSEEDWEAINGP